MNAELVITSKNCDEDIYDWLFGKDGDTWFVITLVIDGNTVSSIVQSKTDVLYEIFNITEDTQSFNVDANRINHLLYKYRKHSQFVDLKKILRPIIRNDISDITIRKT